MVMSLLDILMSLKPMYEQQKIIRRKENSSDKLIVNFVNNSKILREKIWHCYIIICKVRYLYIGIWIW